MKNNDYNLFKDNKNGKLTCKQINMKKLIEKRIHKIEAFEFQHQEE